MPGGTPGPSAILTLSALRVAPTCLVVNGLTPGARYTGTLIISASTTEFKKLTINAAAAAAPTLALDHQAETKQVTRPWWTLFGFGYESPVDSVAILEKSGKGSASGIAARLDPGAKSPSGFNEKLNLSFTKRGDPILDFFTSPTGADATRTVAAGGQSSFDINVRNLVPGEYTIPLRFSGANTGPDTPQTLLTLTVRVRDSVFSAIACLLIAMVISFIVTKILTGQQRRLAMRQRIRDMERTRSADTNCSPAAVWVNAMLRLSERLTSTFWLTGADLIDARINRTKAMIGLLNQVRDLRANLSSNLSPIAQRRALQALDVILYGLNPSTADDARIDAVKAQLTLLNDWLKSDTLPKAFWTTVARPLEELQRRAAAWSNVPEDARACVDSLVTKLNIAVATPPTTLSAVEDAYCDYVRLELLYDHKDEADVFGQLQQVQQDLEQCFHIADKADWARLRASTLSIEMPKATFDDGLEAYDPLSFSITSSDPKAEHSFLFRHNVAFAWKFTLTRDGKHQPGQAAHAAMLEPKAFGPWVTQYFPHRGRVQVSAVLTYGGETIKVDPVQGPTIGETIDFGMFRAFAQIEYVSWGVAGVVALVTGLSSLYFKSGTFGSIQDYLLLFLWGIGADQGKNLLQALQAYSPSSPAGAGK